MKNDVQTTTWHLSRDSAFLLLSLLSLLLLLPPSPAPGWGPRRLSALGARPTEPGRELRAGAHRALPPWPQISRIRAGNGGFPPFRSSVSRGARGMSP